MKKLLFLFIPLLAGICIWSCQSGPSQVENDYQRLLAQEDSLMYVHQSLQGEYQQLKSEHEQIKTQLQSMDNVDTTLLQELAEQDVMLANHEATFQKYAQIMMSHDEFKQKHMDGNMSDEEIQAQVNQMQEDHKILMEDHDKIRNELADVRRTHEDIAEKIQNNNT